MGSFVVDAMAVDEDLRGVGFSDETYYRGAGVVDEDGVKYVGGFCIGRWRNETAAGIDYF